VIPASQQEELKDVPAIPKPGMAGAAPSAGEALDLFADAVS
jgi:hypothetical protein